jgi:hypothetical protein
VDAYTKIEANRIKYIRDHQKELRADLYKGLLDYVTDNLEGVIGRLTVLPSTFIVNYKFFLIIKNFFKIKFNK